MNYLYSYILFNLNKLPVRTLNSLLLELELHINALYLKRKFNDKRSVFQLVSLIKDEYALA